jgi:hypothetical protein
MSFDVRIFSASLTDVTADESDERSRASLQDKLMESETTSFVSISGEDVPSLLEPAAQIRTVRRRRSSHFVT